jgi:hypothetical protein
MIGTTLNYNVEVVKVIRSGGHDHLIRELWWSQLLEYWRDIRWLRPHDHLLEVIVTTPNRSERDHDYLGWLRRWVVLLSKFGWGRG